VKTTEDQLRAIIDTIPVLAWSADLDGSADFFNQRWLDFAGLSVQEARGWGWTAAVHADDLNRLTKYWQSIVAAAEPGEIEARLAAPMESIDGSYSGLTPFAMNRGTWSSGTERTPTSKTVNGPRMRCA
jgi:PAS domain S-box-containing protein